MKEPLKYFIERTTPMGRLARLSRTRQLKKKYVAWQRQGAQGPMPNYGKQKVVVDYIKKHGPEVFIETGTYKGKMVYAVMPYVSQVYSIELDQAHANRAKARFAGYSNITIMQGQSGDVLPEIIKKINKKCLFWLDAHYSGGSTAQGPQDTPIIQELECVLSHPSSDDYIVLIDDARDFVGKGDYPAIEELRKFIFDRKPGWTFQVDNDIIRTHTNDTTFIGKQQK